MAMRQVRAAWPRGCPSVISSAADSPDSTADIESVRTFTMALTRLALVARAANRLAGPLVRDLAAGHDSLAVDKYVLHTNRVVCWIYERGDVVDCLRVEDRHVGLHAGPQDAAIGDADAHRWTRREAADRIL